MAPKLVSCKPPNTRGKQPLSSPSLFMHLKQPIVGFTLVLVVVVVYMNSLSGPFILDDVPSISENRYIRTLWPLTDAMFRVIPDSPPAGRPTVALSLAINYALGGLNVRGYHIFNIIVHALSVLVLWGVVRRTLQSARLRARYAGSASRIAYIVALIWGVHPLHTEAVNYVSQRTELLMGLFYLLTVYCAIRAWQCTDGRLWLVAAVVACAVGMSSKEVMVSAPLVVLLYDATFVSNSWREALRSHAKLYVGMACTWGLLAWFNASAPRGQTCGSHLGVSVLDYLRTQAGIIVHYLRLCMWPHPLVITYDDWPLATSLMQILPQGLLIVILLVGAAYGVIRRHPLGFLGAWLFLILAPTSSVIPIVTEIAAERRMYLPSIAVIVVIVTGGYALLGVLKTRAVMNVGFALCVLVAGGLGVATVIRNRDYQTAVAIWTDTLDKRPNSWMALNNLCIVVIANGEYERAIDYCNKAITLKPNYADGYYNRGLAYNGKGECEQAIRDYNRAIELKPTHAKAYNNRAIAYGEKGDFVRAVADCTKAVELQPDYAEAYFNRALAHSQTGDYARAIDDYTQVMRLEPRDAEVYNARALAYYAIKEYGKALTDLKTCRQLGGAMDVDLWKTLTESTDRAQ